MIEEMWNLCISNQAVPLLLMDILKFIIVTISCTNNASQRAKMRQNYGNNKYMRHFGVLDFTDFNTLILLSSIYNDSLH
jgi:hypothetical protein